MCDSDVYGFLDPTLKPFGFNFQNVGVIGYLVLQSLKLYYDRYYLDRWIYIIQYYEGGWYSKAMKCESTLLLDKR